MPENPYQAPGLHDGWSNAKARRAPLCGIVSVVVTPLSLVCLYSFVLAVDATVGPLPLQVSNTIVLLWLTCTAILFLGSIVGAIARRERVPWLPMVGVAVTAGIVAAFAIAIVNDFPD